MVHFFMRVKPTAHVGVAFNDDVAVDDDDNDADVVGGDDDSEGVGHRGGGLESD